MQRQFQNNESQLRCLVATIAFGIVCVACCLLNGLNIGISVTFFYSMDIPDIELVKYYGIPHTLALFYQVCCEQVVQVPYINILFYCLYVTV